MKTEFKIIETTDKNLFNSELEFIAWRKINSSIPPLSFKGKITLYDIEIVRNFNSYFIKTRVNNLKGSEKDSFFKVEITRDELLKYFIENLKSDIRSNSYSGSSYREM